MTPTPWYRTYARSVLEAQQPRRIVSRWITDLVEWALVCLILGLAIWMAFLAIPVGWM